MCDPVRTLRRKELFELGMRTSHYSGCGWNIGGRT